MRQLKKIKVAIGLIAATLIGSSAGSLLHLTNTVYAEGTVGVRFTAVDNEHPDEKVSYPGIAIVNSNGEVYKYNSMVPDTKFDLTNKPTTDPSGGTLYRCWDDSAETYRGYGDGTTDISAMADRYYWDGSAWLENYPDGLGQASSTGYWYASKYTTTDVDLITGAEMTSYYWSVVIYEGYYVYNNIAYLPEGDYTLILSSTPTSYTDAGGNIHYNETYEFEQSKINFSVETTTSTVTIPVRRIEKQTVTVSTKDASNPDDSVNQAEYLLFDDAGNLINTSGVLVPDEKLDISNIPTVDPSGYPLTASSNGEYTGREYATTSAYFPTYFWNGSSWQKVTIPSSTGCWQAYAQNNGSTTTWTVHLAKEAENTSSWKLSAGNYKLTVEEVPTAYTDSQGVWHSTGNTSDRFFYEAEQAEINFTVKDQSIDVVIPVKRTTFFTINSTFKDTDNPSYQFNNPQYQIFNENGELYKSGSNGMFEQANDMDATNVPVVDPDGGTLVKASYTSNEHDAYEGTVFTSEHSYEDFYWDGTDWQEEAIPSSTGYWKATIQKNYHTDETTGNWVPYEWYWAVRWDSNVYSYSYLAPGNYVLVPETGNEPEEYNDNGTWHYDYEDNFKYEYVQSEISFTVTADATIEIPIEKIQSYRITINPTDRDDAAKQPGYFYLQLFNEEGQIYDGNDFQDDLKLDFSNAPTIDPVGGSLTYTSFSSCNINYLDEITYKIYKGTTYSSDPGDQYYYWNGTSWQKEKTYSSTPYWYASIQENYHTDETTGSWVPYEWYWDVRVSVDRLRSYNSLLLPAGDYTLKAITVPDNYEEAGATYHASAYNFKYSPEQAEFNFTVDADETVNVPFIRAQKYEVYATMKDSKDSTVTYSDYVKGYIKNAEGKYYATGNFPSGFYENTGITYDVPTVDPDGGALTYQYEATYYGPIITEPTNTGTLYWNGTSWQKDPLLSLNGTWYAFISGNHWVIQDAVSDAIFTLGDGSYVALENGTYEFETAIYPQTINTESGSSWLESSDILPIEPVSFTVNNASTTFDIVIERVLKRSVNVTLRDKDPAYQVADGATFRIKNLDTGKFLNADGNEADLIVSSKADIPTVDPVGGTLVQQSGTRNDAPYFYGTEYTEDPMIWGTYYWTGAEWKQSSDYYNGAWQASVSNESSYDSETGTWVTTKWYWHIYWNPFVKGAALDPDNAWMTTIRNNGTYLLEEATPPSGYINPEGVTISSGSASLYKKLDPIQFTIVDESPEEINLNVVYERLILSDVMPNAGERTGLILTMIGCIAMILLACKLAFTKRCI